MFQSLASVIVLGLKLCLWTTQTLGIEWTAPCSWHSGKKLPGISIYLFARVCVSSYCVLLSSAGNWIAFFNPWRVVLDSSFSSTQNEAEVS